MSPTPTPTPEFMNATSGFADSSGLFGLIVVFLLYAGVALLAAQFLAPWLANSRLISRLGHGIGRSIVYALKGLGASAALAIVAGPVYLLAQVDSGTRAVALRYVGYAVAGYLALVAIGWLADRAVAAFIDAHPDYDEWADLFPDDEDESEPEVTTGD